jgi:beta-N-acetylhexosaminidase
MKNQNLGPSIIGIEGMQLTEADIARLNSPKVGGVILFSRNFESLEQLAALTQSIHTLRSGPLPIFVDHEGGRVQRFREGFTAIPAMRSLSKVYATNAQLGLRAAMNCGYVLAIELRACGVDVSFAPVLDLDYGRSEVIGDRALGEDAGDVTDLARALLHGFQMAGMQGCGKHFPGHGWAHADSHFDQPVDERSLDEILSKDAAPYGLLGSLALASVMPAHVLYPQVDKMPAGFSKVWLQDILRNRLAYNGVIISDDLGMAGAHSAGDVVTRARVALEAGCDALLACNDFDDIDALIASDIAHLDPQSSARMKKLMPRTEVPELAELRKDPDYIAAVSLIKTLA